MNTETSKTLVSFFEQFQYKHYKRGTPIIAPDDEVAAGYYIKSGYVKQYNLSSNGVELTIHMFAPRSYFPMMSILSNLPNRFYYEALTDTEVYIAPKDALVTFLKSQSDVLFELTTRLLQGLDKLAMRVEYLALENAHKRVITTLLYLARHFGVPNGSVITIKYPFTHRDIASFAGISRETASREWERLHKQNLVDIKEQHIVLPNLLKLKELSTS